MSLPTPKRFDVGVDDRASRIRHAGLGHSPLRKLAHRLDGAGNGLKLACMGNIIAFDRRDPCLERRAQGEARLERLPYVNRVDAAKRLRVDVAEVDAESGARSDSAR